MPELCIDFGGTSVKLGLVSSGAVLVSSEFPVSGTEVDLETARLAADDLLSLVADAGSDPASELTGVGIALPGVVNRNTGALVRAHGKYAYLVGMDLRAWATTRFGVPAIVENDARSALVGETSLGCAAGATDAVMVTLGTGIGTAALIDGQVLRGSHDHGGILGGHVTVDLDADPCACGNVGCAESLASSWALERQLRAHPDFAGSTLASQLDATGTVTLWALIAAAVTADADTVARDLFDRFVRIWGASIVSLCHAYDPEVVIVAGGVMRSEDAVMPPLARYVHEHLWSSSHRPHFRTPQRPELSVLLGLSVLANPRSSHVTR